LATKPTIAIKQCFTLTFHSVIDSLHGVNSHHAGPPWSSAELCPDNCAFNKLHRWQRLFLQVILLLQDNEERRRRFAFFLKKNYNGKTKSELLLVCSSCTNIKLCEEVGLCFLFSQWRPKGFGFWLVASQILAQLQSSDPFQTTIQTPVQKYHCVAIWQVLFTESFYLNFDLAAECMYIVSLKNTSETPAHKLAQTTSTAGKTPGFSTTKYVRDLKAVTDLMMLLPFLELGHIVSSTLYNITCSTVFQHTVALTSLTGHFLYFSLSQIVTCECVYHLLILEHFVFHNCTSLNKNLIGGQLNVVWAVTWEPAIYDLH